MDPISFRKILVPVDFSATSYKAFDHVKWLAGKFSSEVTLIHIGEQWAYSGIFPTLPSPAEDYMFRYKTLVDSKLQEYKKEFLESGIKTIHLEYLEGNVGQSIIDYAAENKMDLVVMGTHGSSGLKEFFIGSNAFKIVNFIDMPVLTINIKADFSPYKNIIATLDDSMYSRAKFPYIAEMAKILEVDIEILYPEVSDADRKNTIAKYFQQVSDFLEKKKIIHMSRPIAGNFPHEVIKFAEYVNADLIVIMSDTDTTIANMLLGSQSQEIINHSKVPVLTIHPESTGRIKEVYGQFF